MHLKLSSAKMASILSRERWVKPDRNDKDRTPITASYQNVLYSTLWFNLWGGLIEVVLKLGNGGSFGAQNSGNLLTYVVHKPGE